MKYFNHYKLWVAVKMSARNENLSFGLSWLLDTRRRTVCQKLKSFDFSSPVNLGYYTRDLLLLHK